MLKINEMRNNTRRSTQTRRIADRRTILDPFGSPEWLANIEANYLYCPKYDRRKFNRRGSERRVFDRRQQQLSEYDSTDKRSHQLILTREERKLIEDLFLSDLS